MEIIIIDIEKMSVSAHTIPAALAGFQVGLSAGTVGGQIFAERVAVAYDNSRLPGGTTANFARMSAGALGWNIDPNFLIPGDPVESLVDEQDRMTEGLTPKYSFAKKIALAGAQRGPNKYTLVVNVMFTDKSAIRALQDFKNLVGAPINATVEFVEFGNEWFMNRYRGRILGEDVTNEDTAAREREILFDRSNEVRQLIKDHCIEFGIPIPRFIWPWAWYEGRGDQFQAHNDAIIANMEPGDLVAVHDYFQRHGGDAASDLDDFNRLMQAAEVFDFDEFIQQFDQIAQRLPIGSAFAVTEWSVKNRGAGWKGSIADAVATIRYFMHMIFASNARPGMIASANFQNLFSDVFGPGIYTPIRGAYQLDAAGAILTTLFSQIMSGGCRLIDFALSTFNGSHAKNIVGFMDVSGNVTFVYVNPTGEPLTYQFANVTDPGASMMVSGSLIQVEGTAPSDFIGPDYANHLPARAGARLLNGKHGGLIVCAPFSVGIFNVKL